jgi:hypothetical protein
MIAPDKAQQPHCEHECVCAYYVTDGKPCIDENEYPANKCPHDTRLHPHTQTTSHKSDRLPFNISDDDLGLFTKWILDRDAAIISTATLATLDDLGKVLNSRIAKMEVLDANNPSPLRRGILLAYRDVEEWERQQRKPRTAAQGGGQVTTAIFKPLLAFGVGICSECKNRDCLVREDPYCEKLQKKFRQLYGFGSRITP